MPFLLPACLVRFLRTCTQARTECLSLGAETEGLRGTIWSYTRVLLQEKYRRGSMRVYLDAGVVVSWHGRWGVAAVGLVDVYLRTWERDTVGSDDEMRWDGRGW